METIAKVDEALAKYDEAGPWFLPSLGDDPNESYPTLIDILFITSIERIIASVLYYKNIDLLNDDTLNYPNLLRWYNEWSKRPSYKATKSDIYTIIKSLPSQNGPG